ncbi:hypothetical protein PCASD_24062 [Puccinia coronata f. sp. avenae]|uniref:Uncharacterized protein n=1 Tax=Puccinia coronata f. sp. avenae TaxID=200324 RepID=A0A2N5TVL9_9BASI|nr:hypothetical protein PCASD_24062 [Puccinia coronata f. sp. avenae]
MLVRLGQQIYNTNSLVGSMNGPGFCGLIEFGRALTTVQELESAAGLDGEDA